MANETTLAAHTDLNANGQPLREPLPKEMEAEAVIVRATRILSGDIRADDYLPISTDIIAFVAEAEKRGGVEMFPESRQLILSDLALQAHYAGNIVLSHHRPDGVIVLAVGADEIDHVLEKLPPDKQALTKTEYPALLIEDRPPLWE